MRFFDRIQHRTTLFFCLASLVPLVVLALLLYAEVDNGLVSSASRVNRALVEGVQTDIENRLATLRAQFTVLSHMPAIQTLRRDQQDPVLRTFLRYNPTFFKVMTFDRQGTLLSVLWRSLYRGEEGLIGRNMVDEDRHLSRPLRQAMQTGSTVGSDPVVDKFSQSTIYFVAPIFHFVHDDRVIGAVAGGLQLYSHEVQDLIERAHLPEQSYACIVDDGGQIIARRGPWLPAETGRHVFALYSGGRKVEYLRTEAPYLEGRMWLAGRRMFVSVARLPSVGLRLVVGQPWDLVTARARQVAVRIVWLTLGGLLVSVLLGLILARSFVRPLQALVTGIQRVGSGDMSHRVPVERNDELGAAVTAFNDMADELEKRQLIEEIWTDTWQDEG